MKKKNENPLKKGTCKSCQKEIIEEGAIKYGDEFYCKDCTFWCESCSEIYPDFEDSGYDFGGGRICKFCHEESL